MRTKWNKLIVEHFLNGGTILNFDKHLTLADGTDLDVPAWMARVNTSPTQIYAWLFTHGNDPFFPERHRFGTCTFGETAILKYLFPFSYNGISTRSQYSSNIYAASYAYMVSGKYDMRSYYSPTLFFGNGSTEPTEEDYCLESPLEKVFVISVSTNTRLDSHCTVSIKNDSDTDVTIKEVGVFSPITDCNSTPVGLKLAATNFIMLAREVLAEPITIPAGGIGQLYIK